MRSYGNAQRTDKQRLTDALLWCYGAAPHMLAGKTAKDVCATWSVAQKGNQARVAEALVRRQLRESANA